MTSRPRTSAADPNILPKGITVSSSTERDFADQLIALVEHEVLTTWYRCNHLIRLHTRCIRSRSSATAPFLKAEASLPATLTQAKVHLNRPAVQATSF